MDMPNNLPAGFVTVVDDPKTIISEAEFPSYPAGNLVDVANQLVVFAG